MYQLNNLLPAPYLANQSGQQQQLKSGGRAKPPKMVIAHFNPNELHVLDQLQGGAHADPTTGLRSYPGLEKALSHPGVKQHVLNHGRQHHFAGNGVSGISPSPSTISTGLLPFGFPNPNSQQPVNGTMKPWQNQTHGGAMQGPPSQNFAHGGSALERLAHKGRMGDTELALIGPHTHHVFDKLSGRRTRNPHTGHPEYGLMDWATKAIGSALGGGGGDGGGGFMDTISGFLPSGWGDTIKGIANSDIGKQVIGKAKDMGSQFIQNKIQNSPTAQKIMGNQHVQQAMNQGQQALQQYQQGMDPRQIAMQQAQQAAQYGGNQMMNHPSMQNQHIQQAMQTAQGAYNNYQQGMDPRQIAMQAGNQMAQYAGNQAMNHPSMQNQHVQAAMQGIGNGYNQYQQGMDPRQIAQNMGKQGMEYMGNQAMQHPSMQNPYMQQAMQGVQSGYNQYQGGADPYSAMMSGMGQAGSGMMNQMMGGGMPANNNNWNELPFGGNPEFAGGY